MKDIEANSMKIVEYILWEHDTEREREIVAAGNGSLPVASAAAAWCKQVSDGDEEEEEDHQTAAAALEGKRGASLRRRRERGGRRPTIAATFTNLMASKPECPKVQAINKPKYVAASVSRSEFHSRPYTV